MRNVAVVLLAIFALRSIPDFFSVPENPERGARFLVIYSASIYIILSLTSAAGEMIENAIDSYPILSYLKLNRGDSNLIDEFQRRKAKVIFQFIGGCVLAIILGVISSKLEKLI